jgi:hypothetical protein
MGKLKQYEIDAIVSTIYNQIQNQLSNGRPEFAEADAEIEKLNKAIDDVRREWDRLCRVRDERQAELGLELNAYYMVGKKRFEPNKSTYGSGYGATMGDIRNKLIVSQISPDANIDQIIKDIVKEYTK